MNKLNKMHKLNKMNKMNKRISKINLPLHLKEPSLLTQYSLSLHGDCSDAHSSTSVDNHRQHQSQSTTTTYVL